MTKADIVEKVCAATGFTKKDTVEHIEQVFEALKSALESGNKVKIQGFGNFVVKEKADRKGRNPQTGAEIVIESRKVLTFKPSPILRQRVNQ